MKFHLNHKPVNPGFYINHHHHFMMMGSCFAENIGDLLKEYKFKTLVNPNGILFNPVSIFNCLNNAIQSAKTPDDLIIGSDGLFLSYHHHSSFHAASKKRLVEMVEQTNASTRDHLKKTNVLCITFGTAYVYTLHASGAVVSNCHKQPSALFGKRLLEVDEIADIYLPLIEEIKKINPGIKIIFTVSPVKHLRNGVEENNLSKSTLILAVNRLVKQHACCFYFPAYELVNDDLRDYRFYKEDLAHPNSSAIEYVWEKFGGCYFDAATVELNKRIRQLNLALGHRPLKENKSETEKLGEYIARQKEEILKLNPDIGL